MFNFNMHCQPAFQIKHGDPHFHQYYENTTSITSLLARSAILLFFLSQSDEFKVMSHCCFSLQFPSKYRLLFERFPGLICICSLGIASLYFLSVLPKLCLSCQFTSYRQ